jgi:multiple sugar transport system ATP-binding protein
VKVGIRPEHFLSGSETPPDGRLLRLDLPIQLLEKSGADAIAFLSFGNATIAVRVDPRVADRHRHAAEMSVVLPLNKVSVFDAETGVRM